MLNVFTISSFLEKIDTETALHMDGKLSLDTTNMQDLLMQLRKAVKACLVGLFGWGGLFTRSPPFIGQSLLQSC